MNKSYPLIVALLFAGTPLHAQTAQPDSNAEARRHFQAGLQQAQEGNFVAALREFEEAYAAQPHFSVLYNIGQAHSTLGRPVEAIAAFERYLGDGATQVSASRAQEVRALVTLNRSRIGQLRLLVPKAVGRVWLDGVELQREALEGLISVAAGQHTVLCSASVGTPQVEQVSVKSAELSEVRCQPPLPTTQATSARLAVTCSIPDVDIEIVGVSRTKTPVTGTLPVPPGRLQVRSSRPGYVAASQAVSASETATTTLACGLRVASPLPPLLAARLNVSATPSDAEILVDDSRYHGASLPAGRHTIRIQRDGYEPHEATISLPGNRVSAYRATLRPTAAAQQRARAANARRMVAAWTMEGLGAAFVAAGAGLYAWNSRRYEHWRTDRDHTGPTANAALAASVQRADDAALGLAFLGAGLVGGGAWLLFTLE